MEILATMTFSKISQFTDDAQLITNEKSLDTIEKYRKLSGFGNYLVLFLNTDKTQVIWLGNKRRSQIKYMQHFENSLES